MAPVDTDGATLTVDQVRLLISPFDDDASLFSVAIADGSVLSMQGHTDAAGSITLDRIVTRAGEQTTTMDLNAAEVPVRVETVDAAAGTTAWAEFEYGADAVRVLAFDSRTMDAVVDVELREADIHGLRGLLQRAAARSPGSGAASGRAEASLIQQRSGESAARFLATQTLRELRLRATVTGQPEGSIDGAELQRTLTPPDSFGAAAFAFGSVRFGFLQPVGGGVYEDTIPLTSVLSTEDVRQRCGKAADKMGTLSGSYSVVGLVFAGMTALTPVGPVATMFTLAGGAAGVLSVGFWAAGDSQADCTARGDLQTYDLQFPWTIKAEVVASPRSWGGSGPRSHPDHGKAADAFFTGQDVVDQGAVPANVATDLGTLLRIGSIASPDPLQAGSPATFTVDVQGGAGAPTIAWLGPTGQASQGPSFTHTFPQNGSYLIGVDVRDAAGFQQSQATIVRVDPAAPKEPLSVVTLEALPGIVGDGLATVGDGTGPFTFEWNAPGATNPAGRGHTVRGRAGQAFFDFPRPGEFPISVTVRDADGREGPGLTTATVVAIMTGTVSIQQQDSTGGNFCQITTTPSASGPLSIRASVTSVGTLVGVKFSGGGSVSGRMVRCANGLEVEVASGIQYETGSFGGLVAGPHQAVITVDFSGTISGNDFLRELSCSQDDEDASGCLGFQAGEFDLAVHFRGQINLEALTGSGTLTIDAGLPTSGSWQAP